MMPGLRGRDHRTADMFYTKLYIDFQYSIVSLLMERDMMMLEII